MDALTSVLLNGLCGAGFAAAMAVVFTAPRRYVVPSFLCGLAGQLVRGLLTIAGMGVGGATIVASAAAVIVAVAVTPRHTVAPVVLIAAVMPLGAGAAAFHTIVQLLRMSSAEGPALTEAAMNVMTNLGRAFTTLVAVAIGLQLGIVLVQPGLLWRQRRRQ